MPLWTNGGALQWRVTLVEETAWAMSPQNDEVVLAPVEVALAASRCFEANDMTGFGALLDPGVSATAAAGWPEHGRGSERMRW